MRLGRFQVYVYTNVPSIKPVVWKDEICTDLDWAWWTFRWYKKEEN